MQLTVDADSTPLHGYSTSNEAVFVDAHRVGDHGEIRHAAAIAGRRQ